MREDVFVAVGLFAAGLLLGYLVGGRQGETTLALPSNYDPTRAVVADSLKSQQDATERCYRLMIDRLAQGPARPAAPQTH